MPENLQKREPEMLTEEERAKIDQRVSQILLQVGKSYPYDGLENIVESYDDIEVLEYDFGKDGINISGAIAYPENKRPRIFINKGLSPEDKTFTLAHEFGHYILHNGARKFRLDLVGGYSKEEKNDEAEADYFASVLLMPKERFLRVCDAFPDEEVVARYFGVPVVAVRSRKECLKVN